MVEVFPAQQQGVTDVAAIFPFPVCSILEVDDQLLHLAAQLIKGACRENDQIPWAVPMGAVDSRGLLDGHVRVGAAETKGAEHRQAWVGSALGVGFRLPVTQAGVDIEGAVFNAEVRIALAEMQRGRNFFVS